MAEKESYISTLKCFSKPEGKWVWDINHNKAFKEAKNMIQREAMLAYPDFSKNFHIYADASDTQLGGVIMENNNL